jgi:hypothetical protein
MKQFILIATLFLSLTSFAQTSVRHNFYCEVGLDDQPAADLLYVDDEMHEAAEVDLGYGVVVKLRRIDNSRLLIAVLTRGSSIHPPTILDAKKTISLVLSSGGATLNCRPQLATTKN